MMHSFNNAEQFRLPLRVLVARPTGQERELCELLRSHGATPFHLPFVETRPLPVEQESYSLLKSISEFDWCIVTSVNGIKILHQIMHEHNFALPSSPLPFIACIGPRTAEATERLWRLPDFVPTEYRAEAIVPGLGTLSGKHILLARAKEARQVLPEQLKSSGARVSEIPLYSIVRRTDAETEQRFVEFVGLPSATDSVANSVKSVAHEGFTRKVIVLTSGEIARACARLLDSIKSKTALASLDFVCIGPITAEALRAEGYEPTLIADDYTAQGIVASMQVHYG